MRFTVGLLAGACLIVAIQVFVVWVLGNLREPPIEPEHGPDLPVARWDDPHRRGAYEQER